MMVPAMIRVAAQNPRSREASTGVSPAIGVSPNRPSRSAAPNRRLLTPPMPGIALSLVRLEFEFESLAHTFRQLGHDAQALLLGQPEPAGDFLSRAAAALAQSRFGVEDAHADAGAGNTAHLIFMSVTAP